MTFQSSDNDRIRNQIAARFEATGREMRAGRHTGSLG